MLEYPPEQLRICKHLKGGGEESMESLCLLLITHYTEIYWKKKETHIFNFMTSDLYWEHVLSQYQHCPDPRLLWLLVGTPSAFGPELAYRLRVVQPTLMDVPIFLIYFYITIYVCVPHFYDLSALVGCWSSVSMGRIIYGFLNVCPFDYTAVAVSGKVERS